MADYAFFGVALLGGINAITYALWLKKTAILWERRQLPE